MPAHQPLRGAEERFLLIVEHRGKAALGDGLQPGREDEHVSVSFRPQGSAMGSISDSELCDKSYSSGLPHD